MKKDCIPTISEDKCIQNPGRLNRRDFFRLSAMSLAGLALSRGLAGEERANESQQRRRTPSEIKTNIDEVKNIPRKKESLPGKYPGKVIKIHTGDASSSGKLNPAKIKEALERGMMELTGKKDMKKAWAQFVSPEDVVGIKVNPIGGKLLSTKPEVVEVIINGLLRAGVPKENIIIWDRRHFQLADAGFTLERFPGVRISGTEIKGPNNEFFDEKGELWSKDNIDRQSQAYFADIEGKYNRDTLPYMVNEGKHSYFTRIVTQKCTKIINVPILKNAGSSITLCLKNLSFGSLSNTARLHNLWAKAVAEPCAFPCLRDKVVLNIGDGLQGCYEGGPAANPKYIWDANLMLFGTDPVAVDAVGYDFILKERMKRGLQLLEDKKARDFLKIAGELGLGVPQRDNIKLKELSLA